jgi:hypothetical protein
MARNTRQGIPQQPGTGRIACLIAFSPSSFVIKKENVKVKVKYGNQNGDGPIV